MSLRSTLDEREGELARFVASNLRRNLSLLATDFGLFSLGMTFASSSTILPAFAEHLGASNVFIGAIPAVMTLGYQLPPLFSANFTERLSRKLPFILTITVWERIPLLLLALAAFFLSQTRPTLVLGLMLLLLAVITGVGGSLTPAWMDLIGKVIPINYRGRLFAFGAMLGTGLGLAGAVLAGYYLEAFRFPLDYALCFATGFVFLVGSFGALALVLEPELKGAKPHVGFGAYLRQIPEVLARRDHSLTWYLASRGLGFVAAMGNGFYTVYALRTLGAQEWDVAGFTFALLAGQTAANLAFGYVGDHVGHKPVLAIGGLAVALGNAVALASTNTVEVYVVFVCMSVGLAALNVSGLNLPMEFAPPADRPTYIGLATTLIAPLAFFSPLLGGLLADAAGYGAVFALALAAAAASVWILMARVRDPWTGKEQGTPPTASTPLSTGQAQSCTDG